MAGPSDGAKRPIWSAGVVILLLLVASTLSSVGFSEGARDSRPYSPLLRGSGFGGASWAASRQSSGVANACLNTDVLSVVGTLSPLTGTYSVSASVLAVPDLLGPSAVAVGPAPFGIVVVAGLGGSVGLVNSSAGTLGAAAPAGSFPSAAVYDDSSGRLFVASASADNVSVLSVPGLQRVGGFPVGVDPVALTIDTASHLLFVANAGSDNVSRYSLVTQSLTATFNTTSSPEALAADSATGTLFVAERAGFVVALNETTGLVSGTAAAGTDPVALAIDRSNGEGYAANEGSGNVTAFNLTTMRTLGNLRSVGTPVSIAADPADDRLFVSDPSSNQLAVAGASNLSLEKWVATGDEPGSVAWLPGPDVVAVVNRGSGNLTQISGGSLTTLAPVNLSFMPGGVVYDSLYGSVYVANSGSDSIYQMIATPSISGHSIRVGVQPTGLALDSADGLVLAGIAGYLNGTGGRQVIELPTSGIASTGALAVPGTPSSLAFDAGNHRAFVSTLATLQSPRGNTSILDPGTGVVLGTVGGESALSGMVVAPSGAMYLPVSGSPSLEIIDSGATSVSRTVTIPGASLEGSAYDPLTGALLLVDRAQDAVVAYNFSSGSNAEFARTGSVPTAVAFDPGNAMIYVSNSGSGNVSVFDARSGAFRGAVMLGGNPDQLVYDPDIGCVVETNHVTGTLALLSSPGAYGVTFSEAGLPSGASWAVSIDGSSAVGTSTLHSFVLPNGSYNFSVGAPPGFRAAPPSGTLAVSGQPVALSVAFSPISGPTQYGVSFSESGLPVGAVWSVTFNGSMSQSSAASLLFRAPNGTFSFSLGAPAGFIASPATGQVTVAGADVARVVAFTTRVAPLFNVSFLGSGVGSSGSWTVTLNGSSRTASAASVVFTMGNGTFSFVVAPPSGFTVTPSGGSVVVAGAPVEVNLSFATNASTTAGPPSTWSELALLVVGLAVSGAAVAVVAILASRRRRNRPEADNGV